LPIPVGYAETLIKAKICHEVHTSERKSFRGCRRRWSWIFQENFYPVVTAKPLEFGVAYHKAMEVLHNPVTWRFPHLTLGALAEKAFVDTCNEQRKAYLRVKDQYTLDDDASHDYDERIALGRGMIWYYVKNQLPALQKEYTPTHVEVSFDIPMTDVDGSQLYCRCKGCRRYFARAGGTAKFGPWFGNPVVVSGRVDMVVYDEYGQYWLWDFKTAAQLSANEIFLDLDDQVATYVWALRKGLNLNVEGFLYHEQRKAFPEPPKENKVRRLGRIFSVAANQATDYETYLKTVSEQDKEAYEAGLYDAYLTMLKEEGIDYYRRFKLYKSDYELYEVEKNLRSEVLEIINPNLRIYPTPGRFSCQTCAFQTPCISKNQGHDYQYSLETLYEIQEPYYRRQQRKASTDSRGGE
jgi:hypothetical protein